MWPPSQPTRLKSIQVEKSRFVWGSFDFEVNLHSGWHLPTTSRFERPSFSARSEVRLSMGNVRYWKLCWFLSFKDLLNLSEKVISLQRWITMVHDFPDSIVTRSWIPSNPIIVYSQELHYEVILHWVCDRLIACNKCGIREKISYIFCYKDDIWIALWKVFVSESVPQRNFLWHFGTIPSMRAIVCAAKYFWRWTKELVISLYAPWLSLRFGLLQSG